MAGENPALSLNKPDGSKVTRMEAEQEIRSKIKTVHRMRLLAINPYGLNKKFAFLLKPTSIIHWLLDEMVRQKQIEGEEIGVKPELDSDDSYFTAYQQKLAAFVQTNQAVMPKEGEGIDMGDMNAMMPPGSMPPNGQPQQQQPQQGFVPPAPPPMYQQQPQGGYAPQAAPQAAPPPPQQGFAPQPGFAPPQQGGFQPPPPQQGFAPGPAQPQFGPPPGSAPQGFAPPQQQPSFPPQGAPPPIPSAQMPQPQMGAPQGAPPQQAAQGGRRRKAADAPAAPPPPAGPPQAAQGGFAPPAFGQPQVAPQGFGQPQMGAPQQTMAPPPVATAAPDPRIDALQQQVNQLTGLVQQLLPYAKMCDQALSLIVRPYYNVALPTQPQQLGLEPTFKELGLPVPH